MAPLRTRIRILPRDVVDRADAKSVSTALAADQLIRERHAKLTNLERSELERDARQYARDRAAPDGEVC